MKITTLFICVLFSVASATPKFIDWSWSSPSLDFLEQNLEHMKAECPFLDGIVVKVTGKQIEKDGKKWGPVTGNAWGRTPWQFELFDENIARFKKLDFGNFTDNFFYMTTTYADFEWDSDDDFAVVAANFGVAAKVARAIGLKGLGVDIEEYGKKFWNFSNHKTDKTFDEYCEIVFRRGQQWGRAVFAEYPDIVLLMPFCISSEFLELAIPFMNGIIDVMPPTAIIFEGHEASGYIAKIPSDYKEMQLFIRRLIRQKVRPENISKATGQIRLAPAFYMDAYFNDAEEKNWYIRQLEPERSELGPVRLLSRNLAAASLQADPYIWIYGEQACWWKNSPHPRAKRTWNEMPKADGVFKAMAAIKNPLAEMDVTRTTNLLNDPTFQGKDSKWSLWQRENDQKKPAPGDGTVQDGRCVMHNVSSGCFNQSLPVKGSTMYLFYCKGGVNDERGGKANASLCFQDATRKWLYHDGNIQLPIPTTGKPEPVWTFVITPPRAAFISVQCCVKGQSEGGEAFFTEILLEEL